MSGIARLYERLLAALAALAAAAFGALSFIIAYEVVTRWLGFQPPVWPVAVSEYALLYATVLAAPWLLRRAEHIQVQTLLLALPQAWRERLGRAMCVAGAALCLVVAWYGLWVTLTAQGLEIRSFEMPKWIVYAPLPAGFLLMAIEFARHALHGTLFRVDEDDLGRRPSA